MSSEERMHLSCKNEPLRDYVVCHDKASALMSWQYVFLQSVISHSIKSVAFVCLIVRAPKSGQNCFKQEAQRSQRDRASLLVTEYFAKSLKITQGHSKRHC